MATRDTARRNSIIKSVYASRCAAPWRPAGNRVSWRADDKDEKRIIFICVVTQIPPCSVCRPAATLFVDRSVSTQSTVFGSQPQHRRPDLGRQVLEGERGSLVYKIKAPADLNYFDQCVAPPLVPFAMPGAGLL